MQMMVKKILDKLVEKIKGLTSTHKVFLKFALNKLVSCLRAKGGSPVGCVLEVGKAMKKKPKVYASYNEFLGFVRNKVVLKLGKNPCTFECIGSTNIHPLFDAHHKSIVWLPGEDPNVKPCLLTEDEIARAKNYAKKTPAQKKELKSLYDFEDQAKELMSKGKKVEDQAKDLMSKGKKVE